MSLLACFVTELLLSQCKLNRSCQNVTGIMFVYYLYTLTATRVNNPVSIDKHYSTCNWMKGSGFVRHTMLLSPLHLHVCSTYTQVLQCT